MAVASNPFYYGGDSQLGASLGATLGRALFGDPEAAAKLALQKGQMAAYQANAAESNAHAGLYGAQTEDQQTRTGYRKQFGPLGQSFVQLAGPPAAAAPAAPVDPLAPLPDGPVAAPPVDTSSALARAIIPMIMAAGGAQENPNIGDMVGGVTAMLGNDELARRGMIAGGHTPGKEFALTPERADDVAQQGYTADYNKDTAVAKINHYNDVPVAVANHANDIPVARINHANDIRVANIQAGARRDVASLGKTVGFSLVSDVLPGAQMTGGERTPERNEEVGGAPHSYHLPGDGVEAFDIAPGTGARTFEDARAAMQAKYGSRLVEAIDETHTPGHGPHWHFAIADAPGGKTAAAKAPKQVSAASENMIGRLIDENAKALGYALDPGARQNMLTSAVTLFQKTGNPNDAVTQVFGALKNNIAARSGGPTGNVADERARAQRAIASGAPRDQVAALYRQRTGQAL